LARVYCTEEGPRRRNSKRVASAGAGRRDLPAGYRVTSTPIPGGCIIKYGLETVGSAARTGYLQALD